MALLWFNKGIKDYDRIKLKRLYKQLSGCEFIEPNDDFKPVTLKVQLEDPEELEKIMKQRPREKR